MIESFEKHLFKHASNAKITHACLKGSQFDCHSFPRHTNDVQGANQDKPWSQSVGKERVTIQCFISIVSTGNYRTHIKPSLRGFKKNPQYFKRVVIEGIEV